MIYGTCVESIIYNRYCTENTEKDEKALHGAKGKSSNLSFHLDIVYLHPNCEQ